MVLGGAIYTGRWHHDARHLLHQHRPAFARTPAAVFGMGPRTLDAEDVADSRRVIEAALDEVPAVDARDWDAIRDWAQRARPTRARGGRRRPLSDYLRPRVK